MSYSRVPDEATGSTSPTGSPLASPPLKLDTASQQRPRPRPKLVSFGRDLPGGGRPTTEGRANVAFMEAVEENSPFTYSGRRMSREADPLLKETLSPDDEDDDDDWQSEEQAEETKSSWFLFLLTFGGLGLQIGWSVETSNGSVGLLLSQDSNGQNQSCHSCGQDHPANSCVALPTVSRHQQGYAGPCLDRWPAIWCPRSTLRRSQER
jgi:hypothetical protein